MAPDALRRLLMATTLVSLAACGGKKTEVPAVDMAALKARRDSVAQVAVKDSVAKGKLGSIIIVAEGYPGGAQGVADAIQTKTGYETRVSILGHIQRGGSPVSSDRILASRLGEGAVYALMDGRAGVMVGRDSGGLCYTPLNETWEKRKDVSRDLYRCAKTLSV